MKYEPQNNRLPPPDDELPEWAASDLPWRDRRFSARRGNKFNHQTGAGYGSPRKGL